jgi:hypothetical protein
MHTWLSPYSRVLLLITLLVSCAASAQQVDINGPAGSGAFGTSVTVLPNGNIVVTDPNWNTDIGAVYLYQPDGQTLLSFVTGTSNGDHVGSGGIVVLGNGNYVIRSPQWTNPLTNAANAGAVTFCTLGGAGNGTVDETNSLVGTYANDAVGTAVFVLANHNYVVDSNFWNGGLGAVTWGDGGSGTIGPVSSSNSLVGSSVGDRIGQGATSAGVVPLNNGNYVVVSPYWTDTSAGATYAGAVTWVDGNGGGLSGVVSETNSLHGTTNNDFIGIGGVVGLGASGNYVVNSFNWNNGTAGAAYGAVTWGGSSGISGPVSTSNSLYGTHAGDAIGQSYSVTEAVVALSNGNYAVASSSWNGNLGAVTWGNGSTGVTGAVGAANSFVGSTAGDMVGASGLTALTNGNYVATTAYWGSNKGAATWLSGTAATTGSPSSANSLIGNANDYAGGRGAFALTNGNYVVLSPSFNSSAGAATWSNGSSAALSTKGVISSSNSLVGAAANDSLGDSVVALSNGNYVVRSHFYAGNKGAATWGNGTAGVKGAASATNSLVGAVAGDQIGFDVHALSNGDYVLSAPNFSNGATTGVGAITWADGRSGIKGTVTSVNSVVGAWSGDAIGATTALNNFRALSNSSYIFVSSYWSNDGAISQAGAVTLQRGNGPYAGTVDAKNSVLGQIANSGRTMVFDHDASRDRLVVGRPTENIVTLFLADELFKSDLEVH